MARLDDSGRACPYRGLEPFDEGDAAYFFGRERETRLITASLFAAPLTLLYGASGVGKSSVLRAGVLPRLRQRSDLLPVIFPAIARENGRPSQPEVIAGWQYDPTGGIKGTVEQALYESAGADPERRQRYENSVHQARMLPLREFLAACHEVSERRIMVILDQFEEYSLYHPDDDYFAREFPAAATVRDLSVSFLVSLREDALSKLDRFKGRIPTLWDSYRRVDHLDHAAAEDAIRLPLREYNRSQSGEAPMDIEDSLVRAVLDEVQTEAVQFEQEGIGAIGHDGGGSIETPYLQLVMMRLWERERAEESNVLRSSTLRSEGGAAAIVLGHLDRVMAHFTDEERDVAARIFNRLVTPSGAKIAFTADDLAEYETIEPKRLRPILERLEQGSNRILRRVASRSERLDEPRYEIFHDRLGKAILSWRAKRLREQERDRKQREESEQRRLAAETVGRYRESVEAAMKELGADGQAVWSRMMFYLVFTDGRRVAQTAGELAKLSNQPYDAVLGVLERLLVAGILQVAQSRGAASDEWAYEVAHDGLAGALLEWHSQFVLRQTQPPRHSFQLSGAGSSTKAEPRFAYQAVSDALWKGRVIPFLGAGASLSARPQDAASAIEGKPFLPSAREMKEILARECDFPAAAFQASDTAEVASFYVYRAGREALDQRLHEILGRTDYAPSETHRFLAEVAAKTPLTILTTNYDGMMEQALTDSQTPFDVLAYAPREGDAAFVLYSRGVAARPYTSAEYPGPERTLVVRLNGPALTDRGRLGCYVVTEEDQIDWLLAMENTESSRRALPPLILQKLQENSLLSLGHSARDWTQRALLRTIAAVRSRSTRRSWAVALNPSLMSIMTWQRYEVEVSNLDLNEWAAHMRSYAPPAPGEARARA